MEQLNHKLLYRWFVGLSMERMEDAEIWDTTVFSKDRDRLLKGDTARAFFRKTRHRRLAPVGWMFTFGVAVYNLVRMRNPMEVRA